MVNMSFETWNHDLWHNITYEGGGVVSLPDHLEWIDVYKSFFMWDFFGETAMKNQLPKSAPENKKSSKTTSNLKQWDRKEHGSVTDSSTRGDESNLQQRSHRSGDFQAPKDSRL